MEVSVIVPVKAPVSAFMRRFINHLSGSHKPANSTVTEPVEVPVTEFAIGWFANPKVTAIRAYNQQPIDRKHVSAHMKAN